MTSSIGPITPVVGFVDPTPELTPEQRLGGPADPRHGLPLLQNPPRHPWEVLAGIPPSGPYGTEAQLVGDTDGALEPAGSPGQDPYFDYSPDTHAAPWPKGVETSVDPDAVARTLQQSAAIHAADMGASEQMVHTLDPRNDQWTDFSTVGAGSTIQDPNIPPQIKSSAPGGIGSTDRVSSFAQQNRYGFDAAHSHRRWATGSIPGNYMWMEPGSRPLVKTTPIGGRPPVGHDSPFTGQDPAVNFGLQGAVLAVAPTEYTPPADPYVAPQAGPAPEPGPVAWW